MWHYAGMHTFPSSKRPFEIILFYLIPAYFTLHINYWTYVTPDIGFTADSDSITSKGAGGVIAVVLISIGGLAAFAWQMYVYWHARILSYFITRYLLVIIVMVSVTLAMSANFEFHLHHWAFAFVLLPATRGGKRATMFIQALLFGLYVNGVAEWGAASIWEEKASVTSVADIDKWAPTWNGVTTYANTNATIKLSWSPPANVVVPVGNFPYRLTMNEVEILKDFSDGNMTVTLPITGDEDYLLFQIENLESSYKSFTLMWTVRPADNADQYHPVVSRRGGRREESHQTPAELGGVRRGWGVLPPGHGGAQSLMCAGAQCSQDALLAHRPRAGKT